MESKEGNKLIAEFMGGEFYRDTPTLLKTRIESPTGRYITCIDKLLYHSDWRWIMAVVEKIEKMDYGFKMCRKVVEVYIDSTKEVILKTKEANRLESLYKAVIEFIKWYNKQKSLPTDKTEGKH